MKTKTLLLLLLPVLFFSCNKNDELPEPDIKKNNWDVAYKGNTTLAYSNNFFVINDKTGGIAVNTPTTVMILMTTNGGLDWTEINTGITSLAVWAVDFQNKDVGYISLFEKGTFKTEDGGKTWSFIHECTCGITADINSVTLVSNYATFYSTDNGATFTEQDFDHWQFQNPTNSFRFGDKVYYYFNEGIAVSEDGGLNWLNANMNFSTILGMVPMNNTKWFLISGNNLFVTSDAGNDWQQVDNESYNHHPAAKGDTLFVNRNGYIQWTKDSKNFTIDEDEVKNINLFSIGNNLFGFSNNTLYRRKY